MNYLANLSPMNSVRKLFSKKTSQSKKQNYSLQINSSTDTKQLKEGEKKTQTTSKTNLIQEKMRQMVRFRLNYLNPMMSISYYPYPIMVHHAIGQYFYQQSGQKILDCINNVSHIGHCHPYYVMKMQHQLNVLLTNSRFLYDELNIATKKLLKKFPPELCCVTWANSGSQANDLAMQMASVYTKKRSVICLDGAYHGITRSCMDVSPYKWNQDYVKSKDVIVAHSPSTYRGFLQDAQHPAKKYCEYLETIITEDTGAFISQLMQSCAGQIIPPKDFFKQVYGVLRKKGIVCIGDEVQTGFGRLGSHFWAFEYYGVIPDIVTVGKAMGNGFPVSAVICTRQIADAFKKRNIEFFSTFGGNPLAATAVNCVLDVIDCQKLQQNALETGLYLKQKLIKLQQVYPFIGDVRGEGLFQGIDIVKDKISREQDEQMAKKIITSMRKKGVIVSRDGPKHNILKIKPPMVFNKQNVDELMKALISTLQQLK